MTYKEEIEWKAWNDLIWQSPSSDKWSKRLADVTDGRLDFDRVHNAVKKMKYHIENDIVSDKAQKIFKKLYHLWENKEYVYGIFSPSFYKGRFTFGEKLSADEIAAVRTVFDTNKLHYECLYNEESDSYSLNDYIEALFESFENHSELIPSFVQKLYTMPTQKSRKNTDSVLGRSFLFTWLESCYNTEDCVFPLMSKTEEIELIKKICKVVPIKYDFSSIDYDLIRRGEDEGVNQDEIEIAYKNSLQCMKICLKTLLKIRDFIAKNKLESWQYEKLFYIAKFILTDEDFYYETLLHEDKRYIYTASDILNMLPMVVRYEVFGPLDEEARRKWREEMRKKYGSEYWWEFCV